MPAALAPLLPASTFNDLVRLAEEDAATELVLLQRLGQAFQANAPPSWQRPLSLVHALGGVPRDVLDVVFLGRAGAEPGVRGPELPAEEIALAPDLLCPFLGLDDLLRNKRSAGGPQDLADVAALEVAKVQMPEE